MIFEIFLTTIIGNKYGVEIGGPSSTGKHIYTICENMDNVIFSNNTVWSKHTETYRFARGKEGKVIINDATDIHNIESESYDFCFSLHCLEHIANPLKAVKEWLRITKLGGYIVMILPEKSRCFDHKQNISSFSTLLTQYENNVGEDDLSLCQKF